MIDATGGSESGWVNGNNNDDYGPKWPSATVNTFTPHAFSLTFLHFYIFRGWEGEERGGDDVNSPS